MLLFQDLCSLQNNFCAQQIALTLILCTVAIYDVKKTPVKGGNGNALQIEAADVAPVIIALV